MISNAGAIALAQVASALGHPSAAEIVGEREPPAPAPPPQARADRGASAFASVSGRGWVAVTTALGLTGAVVFAVVGSEGGAEAQTAVAPPPPPEVTVAQPVLRPVDDWSEHTGRFVAVQEVDVRPRVSGYLQRAHFVDGEYVRQGQLLFTLDPIPLRAESDRAAADVAQADARLTLARSEFERAQALFAIEAISQELFETRREAVRQATAARSAAEAALRSRTIDLGFTRVLAPISGRASDRRVDAGNLVQASETVLTRIVSANPIHLEFAVPEGLLAGSGGPRVSSDAPRQVAVQLEGETGYPHLGRLDFIDNQIAAGTGTVRARAVFANDGRFTPGQFARVRVVSPARAPSLLVPEGAISADQSRRYVLVANARNIAEYRPVTLGQRVDGLRVVKAGLSPRDRVVINGLQRVVPGQPVRPRAGRVTTAVARPAAAYTAG
jgi:RND family efflux transporter MFP subunit